MYVTSAFGLLVGLLQQKEITLVRSPNLMPLACRINSRAVDYELQEAKDTAFGVNRFESESAPVMAQLAEKMASLRRLSLN